MEHKKDGNNQRVEKQQQLKADEEYNTRQKNRRILEKQEASTKLVQKFMEEQAHELMLK